MEHFNIKNITLYKINMPALSTVTFTSTHSDSYEPTCLGNGVWALIVPDSSETLVADSTTQIDMHLNVTIPTGYIGLVVNSDSTITGATGCGVIPQLLRGTGSPVALLLNIANPTGAGPTATANNTIAHLIVIKETEYKTSQSGTWA